MIRFSFHARRQMEARRIGEREVLEALDDRETSYDSRHRNDRLVVLGRTRNGRRLKVVLTKTHPEVVVTVADRDQED